MRILRAADHRRMPWKNGKGETVEIAVFPPGASVETFDWRVSAATVAEDGPFSLFDGIDRTLSVLSGEGIVLSVAGSADLTLTGASAPHAFPADATAAARLVGGPITDLNVMTRRGLFTHRVEKLAVPADLSAGLSLRLPATSDLLLLYCSHGSLCLTLSADETALLGAHDCAMVPAGQAVEITGKASGFLIRISGSA